MKNLWQKIKENKKKFLLTVLGVVIFSIFANIRLKQTELAGQAIPLKVPFSEIRETAIIGNTIIYSWKGNEFNASGKEMDESGWKIRNPNKTITRIVLPGKQFIPENGKWFVREYATTTLENFNKNKPVWKKLINTAFADQLFPVSDGRTGREVTNESWATIRAGAGTTLATAEIFISLETGSSAYNAMQRGIFCFNTNVGGGTVLSATLSLKPFARATAGGDYTVNTTDANPADTRNLASGDYAIAQFGNTQYSTAIAISAFTLESYADWVMDANGLANLSLTADTCYSIRLATEITNTDPGQAANLLSYVNFRSAATAGTASDPYLTFTYSSPANENEPFFDGFIYNFINTVYASVK